MDAGNGGAQSGSESGANGTTTPAAATPAAEGGQQQGQTFGQFTRPDGLPDEFWDDGAKAVRLPELLKDYTGLAADRAQRDAARQNLPKAERDYLLQVPADLKLDVTFDDKHPMATLARGFAKAQGLSQAQFSDLVGRYAQMTLEMRGQLDAQHREEMGKLGARADSRVQAVDGFLKGHLSEDQYAAIQGAVTTAAGVRALETLVEKFGGSKLATGGTGGGQAAPTLDQVRQEMSDNYARYLKDAQYRQGIEQKLAAALAASRG